MKIKRKDDGEVTVLELHGNFTGGPDSETFAGAIDQLIAEKRLFVVVNFHDVKFINSPGIGIVVRNYAHFARTGGTFVVSELNDRISILFDMMLRKLFVSFEKTSEAVAELKKEAEADKARAAASRE